MENHSTGPLIPLQAWRVEVHVREPCVRGDVCANALHGRVDLVRPCGLPLVAVLPVRHVPGFGLFGADVVRVAPVNGREPRPLSAAARVGAPQFEPAAVIRSAVVRLCEDIDRRLRPAPGRTAGCLRVLVRAVVPVARHRARRAGEENSAADCEDQCAEQHSNPPLDTQIRS